MTIVKDFSLNIPWLIRQFREEILIINADPERTTPGILGRKLRSNWIGDMLIATGHRIDYKTGKVVYTRNVS